MSIDNDAFRALFRIRYSSLEQNIKKIKADQLDLSSITSALTMIENFQKKDKDIPQIRVSLEDLKSELLNIKFGIENYSSKITGKEIDKINELMKKYQDSIPAPSKEWEAQSDELSKTKIFQMLTKQKLENEDYAGAIFTARSIPIEEERNKTLSDVLSKEFEKHIKGGKPNFEDALAVAMKIPADLISSNRFLKDDALRLYIEKRMGIIPHDIDAREKNNVIDSCFQAAKEIQNPALKQKMFLLISDRLFNDKFFLDARSNIESRLNIIDIILNNLPLNEKLEYLLKILTNQLNAYEFIKIDIAARDLKNNKLSKALFNAYLDANLFTEAKEIALLQFQDTANSDENMEKIINRALESKELNAQPVKLTAICFDCGLHMLSNEKRVVALKKLQTKLLQNESQNKSLLKLVENELKELNEKPKETDSKEKESFGSKLIQFGLDIKRYHLLLKCSEIAIANKNFDTALYCFKLVNDADRRDQGILTLLETPWLSEEQQIQLLNSLSKNTATTRDVKLQRLLHETRKKGGNFAVEGHIIDKMTNAEKIKELMHIVSDQQMLARIDARQFSALVGKFADTYKFDMVNSGPLLDKLFQVATTNEYHSSIVEIFNMVMDPKKKKAMAGIILDNILKKSNAEFLPAWQNIWNYPEAIRNIIISELKSRYEKNWDAITERMKIINSIDVIEKYEALLRSEHIKEVESSAVKTSPETVLNQLWYDISRVMIQAKNFPSDLNAVKNELNNIKTRLQKAREEFLSTEDPAKAKSFYPEKIKMDPFRQDREPETIPEGIRNVAGLLEEAEKLVYFKF